MTQESFYGLGIAPGLLQTLDRLRLTIPTPIQHKAIPIANGGEDVIGIAQTGTGKTLAFGLPMLQRLAQGPGRGLVLVPTRELALQVNDMLMALAPAVKMKTVAIIGGESIGAQIQRLKQQPRIIVATPGRLNDIVNQRLVNLGDIHILVLDEADRMLDMGFLPQIERIIRLLPKKRQTMLFSATIPSTIVKIASTHMRMPVHVEVAPSGTAAETVSQEIFVVARERKGKLLGELLKKYTGSVLLFIRTRRSAKRVAAMLKEMGYAAAEIHADRTLAQRKQALEGFKSGRYRILVATDIAARGIDVMGIELVVNFDLPDDPENYVHRIGRTGRAGQPGHAVTLATPDQGHDVRNIERIIKASIPVSQHPDVPAEDFHMAAFKRGVSGPGRTRSFGSLHGRRGRRR